ncbi:low temperature requirement protein A [Micromonospora sp. NPDC050784]|uniref:low temperature requirement protein A n=1 Tax=Micromonospora sp. NPDC050784 TaxID=3364281 RepID=UPI0037B25E30
MKTEKRPGLVRDLGQPKQATYVELFFDVIYIFILFRLSQTLLSRLDWTGAYQTLILLLAVWWVWSYTNLVTDTLDSRLIHIQLLVIATMFGGLLISTTIPEAFEQRGLLFAIAYVAINLGRSSLLAIALRRDPLGCRPLRAVPWFVVSAVPWFAGALVDETARVALWSLAIAIDYLAALSGWPTPKLGRTNPSEWNLASEHLAERYRQFIIIGLGETVITTGRTFHASEFSLHRGAAFTVAFVTTVLLYFTYFYRTREKLGTAFSHAHEPGFRNRESAFAHLLMVAGIVAITVSDEMAIVHATAAAPASWLVIILSGPALFLAGHALLGRHAFTRVSMPRLIGLGALIAIGPPLVGQPVLVPAAAAAVVLAGIVGFDLLRGGREVGDQSLPPRL